LLDTLSKAKDMTLKAKDMMYDAIFKALQKLYLGHFGSNQYKIAQKAMSSLILTKMLTALKMHQVTESIFSPRCARRGYNILSP